MKKSTMLQPPKDARKNRKGKHCRTANCERHQDVKKKKSGGKKIETGVVFPKENKSEGWGGEPRVGTAKMEKRPIGCRCIWEESLGGLRSVGKGEREEIYPRGGGEVCDGWDLNRLNRR